MDPMGLQHFPIFFQRVSHRLQESTAYLFSSYPPYLRHIPPIQCLPGKFWEPRNIECSSKCAKPSKPWRVWVKTEMVYQKLTKYIYIYRKILVPARIGTHNCDKSVAANCNLSGVFAKIGKSHEIPFTLSCSIHLHLPPSFRLPKRPRDQRKSRPSLPQLQPPAQWSAPYMTTFPDIYWALECHHKL